MYKPMLEKLRSFFSQKHTLPYSFRKEQLLKLKEALLRYENRFYESLYTDLRKSPEEVWVTETGMVLSELRFTLRHLKQWMEPEAASTNLLNFPSRSRIVKEPLGVTLIVAPWNYPLQLLINPLIGAMAAGNCVVLKPSELAPATSAVMAEMIKETFAPEYILCVEGEGKTILPEMLSQFRFDHIFFTGSPAVGKIIYSMAAAQLTPVTLELGGKSPCVIERDANLKVAARRIALTKFSNAGQMCVAPDYVLVHVSVYERFLQTMSGVIKDFFGEDARKSYDYGRIVNAKHFERLEKYLNEGTVFAGGEKDKSDLYIAPTLLTGITPGASVMQEEIFGPILPVIPFREKEEAMAVIQQHPDPLAFYVFTSDRTKEKEWIEAVPSGGACVNNAALHVTNHYLPFGGRGNSGIGRYHGKFSFDTFSHIKAVMKTPVWFDPRFKYPGFRGKLKWFKKMIR
ncbi:MAG: aldehyde dehydrogenase [Chitinophagaceae bacterium]|nr:aldehyde dehydrogenase [Chitinophagaceae bacterium]